MEGFYYSIYDLVVCSERPLSFLQRSTFSLPDITIKFSALGVRQDPPVSTIGKYSIFADQEVRFNSGLGFEAAISSGRLIVVDACSHLSEAGLHAALFGPALGWLLFQRGLVPLHGCGLEIDGQLVAIVGHSGAGKSTLGRALVARGHRLRGDDQLIVDPVTLSVPSGMNALRLWRDTVLQLGDSISEEARIISGFDKYYVDLGGSPVTGSVPLRLVLALGCNPSLGSARFVRLDRPQSAAMLCTHIYQRHAAFAAGYAPAALKWGGQVAAKVPVVALDRPNSFAALSGICDKIEHLVESALGTAK